MHEPTALKDGFPMNAITQNDLFQLVREPGDRCVSLYMPIYTGAESRQNPTRLKKRLRNAENGLSLHGTGKEDGNEVLAPLTDLFDHLTFGEEEGRGLAAFAGRGGARAFRMDVPCDELCVVGRHFYIIPVVISLAEHARFYVLAVSQNQVRLLRGNRIAIEEITVPNLPTNIKAALNLDTREPSRQAHPAHTDMTKHKEGLVFHGHGGEPDAAEAELLNYCRAIERAVSAELQTAADPLILAGVDYLFPIYREVNRYSHLIETPIIGNPELLSDADLQQCAWTIIEPILDQRRHEATERYGDCIAQGRISNAIDEILVAASAGAVETLFIDPAVKRTGSFEPEELTVRIDEEPQEGNEDLVNLAATIVLRNSGLVIPMPSGDVPGGGLMAAILRYPFPPSIEQMSTASQTQRRR
jgi:hypothetical protein